MMLEYELIETGQSARVLKRGASPSYSKSPLTLGLEVPVFKRAKPSFNFFPFLLLRGRG